MTEKKGEYVYREPEYHKGEVCPYSEKVRVCVEGYCAGCQINSIFKAISITTAED